MQHHHHLPQVRRQSSSTCKHCDTGSMGFSRQAPACQGLSSSGMHARCSFLVLRVSSFYGLRSPSICFFSVELHPLAERRLPFTKNGNAVRRWILCTPREHHGFRSIDHCCRLVSHLLDPRIYTKLHTQKRRLGPSSQERHIPLTENRGQYV